MAGVNIGTTLDNLNTIETGINNNKVVKFAYTQNAYDDNDVNGVTEYDVENENNIPTSATEVIKVNETVISKGFRNKASSLTRMLMNHIFGRVSYNLNKIHDNFQSLLTVLRQGFHPVYFGTCSTASATALKVITVTDFVFETGAMLYVKFTNPNTVTSGVQFSIDGTTKYVYKHGISNIQTDADAYAWQSYETVPFLYDGSAFQMMKPVNINLDSNGILHLEY